METETWTVKKLLDWTDARFGETGIARSRYQAEVLLAEALGWKRIELYTRFDAVVDEPERARFRGFVKRRLKREPLQYITGSCGFMNCTLEMREGVFIPRPETEVVVETVLGIVNKEPKKGPVRALDLGTGTGAIAVSVAKEIARATVLATDISREALALAEKNAGANGVSEQVRFLESDLFKTIEAGERFDFVLSNPPYVATGEREALEPEVRDFEPPEALFAGADGLDVLRKVIAEAPPFLAEGGRLVLEIGETQKDDVGRCADECPGLGGIAFVKDYDGKFRVLVAEKR